MSQQNNMNHQFNLFGFQKPRAKVPISKEQIEQAKQLHAQGKFKDSAELEQLAWLPANSIVTRSLRID